MKNIVYILLFFLLSTSVFRVNSQTVMLIPFDSNDQKVTHIKEFKSKYIDGIVYMNITICGNTKTNLLAIERSLDATSFEVIGYVKVIGIPVQDDIAYYFTDKMPVIANLYYRLKGYSYSNDPVYSETIGVIPIDEFIISPDIIAITPVCDEKIISIEGECRN